MTLTRSNIQSSLKFRISADALATLASMFEIPKGVWTWALEIEQSYGLVHKEKAKASVLVIEEEGVP